MSIRQIVKPYGRHHALGNIRKWLLHQGHRIGPDVEREIRKWTLAGKSVQIVGDEHEIKSRRISQKHRRAGQGLEPRYILRHGGLRGAGILPGSLPRMLLCFPPRHSLGIAGRTWQKLKICRKRAHQRFVRLISSRRKAQHRVDPRNGAIGLYIRAHIDFHRVSLSSISYSSRLRVRAGPIAKREWATVKL